MAMLLGRLAGVLKNKASVILAKGTGTKESDLKIIGRLHSNELELEKVHVVKEGWLHKQGKINPKWVKRYFLLVAPGFLIYFEKKEQAEQFKKHAIKIDRSGDRGASVADKYYFHLQDLMKGTFRFCALNDGEDCKYWKRVKCDNFEFAADAWLAFAGIIKERTHLLKVKGHQKKKCVRYVKLSADSQEERQAWLDAIPQCESFVVGLRAQRAAEEAARKAAAAEKKRLEDMAVLCELSKQFKMPFTGGTVTAPNGVTWTFTRVRKTRKDARNGEMQQFDEEPDTLIGSNGVKLEWGASAPGSFTLRYTKGSPGFGNAELCKSQDDWELSAKSRFTCSRGGGNLINLRRPQKVKQANSVTWGKFVFNLTPAGNRIHTHTVKKVKTSRPKSQTTSPEQPVAQKTVPVSTAVSYGQDSHADSAATTPATVTPAKTESAPAVAGDASVDNEVVEIDELVLVDDSKCKVAEYKSVTSSQCQVTGSVPPPVVAWCCLYQEFKEEDRLQGHKAREEEIERQKREAERKKREAEEAEKAAKKAAQWKDRLYGKIKVVSGSGDVKVQIVTSFPDLKVKKVTSFPDKKGQWQFVDSFGDFKVQFVTSFPDIKIQYVTSFEGPC